MTFLSELFGRRFGLIVPESTDVRRERDLPAVMDDGAVLYADRWVAAVRADVPQPTVLVRTPYGRGHLVGLLFGRLLAERGLQSVVQSVRGTFGSEGAFEPFDERADGVATLRWLREQPWHAGPIGTMGPSYLGLTQWAMAAGAPDALAAMAVQVTASQFHDQTYAGGSVALETVASWLVIIALQERRLGPLSIARTLRGLHELMADHPLVGLDELATGAPVPWLREGFEHPARDSDYWTRRDFSVAVGQVTTPVSFVGGWYDFLLPWMLDDYTALHAADRAPRLLIGPWAHTSPELAAAGHRDGIAWMRAHLLSDERLLAAEDRPTAVRIWTTGADAGWRDLETWPPPEASDAALHVRADGRLTAEPPAEGEPVADAYRYDPADPTPSLGGPVLLTRTPVLDNAPLEQRADVLVYTSEPLPVPLEAIGRPRARMWIRADRPWFDVFVRICEVDSDGVSRNVCDGLTSVSPPAGASRSGAEPRCVEVELWPLAHRFAAGHRLRVQVSSGAHPRFARNPGTGADPAGASPAAMVPVRIELVHDGDHPSAVTVPTMPAGAARVVDAAAAIPVATAAPRA